MFRIELPRGSTRGAGAGVIAEPSSRKLLLCEAAVRPPTAYTYLGNAIAGYIKGCGAPATFAQPDYFGNLTRTHKSLFGSFC